MKSALILLVAVMLPYDLYAAMCGKSEYFEYKFKPLKVGPVKTEDHEKGGGRCGHESDCDIIVQIYGTEKCKPGKNKEGAKLTATENMNVVTNANFEPREVGYAVHSDWDISHAYETPFSINVCDEDGGLRGGNDRIMSVTHQHLQPGCHGFRYQEDEAEQKHPWEMEYEICCRPIAKAGFFRGQKGG